MKIGVASDSHDNIPAIRKAVEFFNESGVDLILNAGDIVAPFAAREWVKARAPLIGVFGNNDGERLGLAKVIKDIQAGPRLVESGGRKIALAHMEEDIPADLRAKTEIVVSGHTHVVALDKGSPLRLNPGECGGWLTGRKTVAILDTETLDAQIFDL